MLASEAADVMLKFFKDAAEIYATAIESGYAQEEIFATIRDMITSSWGATPKASANIVRIIIHRACLQRGWVSPFNEQDMREITRLAFETKGC